MIASFLIQTLNGLASASLLFLVALGLTLIFGVTRVVNFAHGSFFMLGAYLGVIERETAPSVVLDPDVEARLRALGYGK